MLYRLSYVGGKSNWEQILLFDLSLHTSSHPKVERVSGIEPPPSAWKAEVLPLNYTRLFSSYLALFGVGGRIRTYEGNSQQIYSLPPLAAWVPLRGHKPAIVFSDLCSVNQSTGELGDGGSPRALAVQQHHEIGLAFGQPEAGDQP